jgi:hypothetical protein
MGDRIASHGAGRLTAELKAIVDAEVRELIEVLAPSWRFVRGWRS